MGLVNYKYILFIDTHFKLIIVILITIILILLILFLYINYILFNIIYVDNLYILIYHFNGFSPVLSPLNSPRVKRKYMPLLNG